MLARNWHRRGLFGALPGFVFGGLAGAAPANAAGKRQPAGRTVYEYRALSDWNRLADLVPTITKEAVPDGWQIHHFMCSNPDRQPVYHAVLRRVKEGGEFQDDPTIYEYTYLANFGDLLDMTRRVTREYAPSGWQIRDTWWTGSGGGMVWHALLQRPLAH